MRRSNFWAQREEERIKRSVGLLVAAALAQAGCAAVGAGDPPISGDWLAWNAPVPPHRIAGELYSVGAANVAAYALRTPAGIVVIDTGFAQTVPLLIANLRALDMDPKDIRLILMSHAHADHAGGVAALKALTGATVAASAEDAALLARGGRGDFAFGDDIAYRPARADRILTDGEAVTLGGLTLTAHVTPGHTRGCTTWTLRAGGQDVLFPCGTSAPGYRLIGNAAWPDIVPAYRRTFARLAAMPCDIILAGHPQAVALAERAAAGTLVDRERCRRTIADARDAFEAEVARQQTGQFPPPR